MTTEIIINPVEVIDQTYALVTQVAAIEPDGARSATRLVRNSTFFAINARRAVESGINNQGKSDPDAEATSVYALAQANIWKDHVTAMMQRQGTTLPDQAIANAQNLAANMRARLEQLTGRG